MSDENGFDFKILCVAEADPQYSHYHQLDDVSPHRLREIENFFETYKLLEDKEVEIVGWRDAERARQVLVHDRDVFVAEEAARVP
jgi:inorganic pyrophosphatase